MSKTDWEGGGKMRDREGGKMRRELYQSIL